LNLAARRAYASPSPYSSVRLVLSLRSRPKIRPAHWLGATAIILLIDFVTGPFIRFPVTFIVPVALATVGSGRTWGLTLAAILPLAHLSFYLAWPDLQPWSIRAVNAAVDMSVLGFLALLIERIMRQQRAVRVLEGMLPICGFCKRIRVTTEPAERWESLEQVITERSEARFSHTFCPECGRKHYGRLVE
jgi:hypothetical protein